MGYLSDVETYDENGEPQKGGEGEGSGDLQIMNEYF